MAIFLVVNSALVLLHTLIHWSSEMRSIHPLDILSDMHLSPKVLFINKSIFWPSVEMYMLSYS